MRIKTTLGLLQKEGILDIRAGHPFRGRVTENAQGDVRVVQIRDTDPDRDMDWGSVIQADMTGRGRPDWLRSDDILVVARGRHNFAVALKAVPENTVCMPHFFRIRVNPSSPASQGAPLLPAFLAWQMNQRAAQRHFQQVSEGTLQRSVRRGELEALEVVIPELEQQQTVVNFIERVNTERRLLDALIENRAKMVEAIANDVLGKTQLNTERRLENE